MKMCKYYYEIKRLLSCLCLRQLLNYSLDDLGLQTPYNVYKVIKNNNNNRRNNTEDTGNTALLKRNTPPNTSLSTSNNNESGCAGELQVAETSHQSISLDERTKTPALSTRPITTEVKAVETDPDAPAESVTSKDSEVPLDANVELVCAGETLFPPAFSTGPITTEVKAVETDPDAPAESVTSIDSESPAGDADLELVCRFVEVQSISPGPYWFQPITPEAAEEFPYDDDDREVAFVSGLSDETVRRRQKQRRFLSVVRSAVRRVFRAVCCGCVDKQKKTERRMLDSSDGGGSSGADSGK